MLIESQNSSLARVAFDLDLFFKSQAVASLQLDASSTLVGKTVLSPRLLKQNGVLQQCAQGTTSRATELCCPLPPLLAPLMESGLALALPPALPFHARHAEAESVLSSCQACGCAESLSPAVQACHSVAQQINAPGGSAVSVAAVCFHLHCLGHPVVVVEESY